MFGNSRFVGRDNVLYDKSIGVRPAIEVSKTNVEYQKVDRNINFLLIFRGILTKKREYNI